MTSGVSLSDGSCTLTCRPSVAATALPKTPFVLLACSRQAQMHGVVGYFEGEENVYIYMCILPSLLYKVTSANKTHIVST